MSEIAAGVTHSTVGMFQLYHVITVKLVITLVVGSLYIVV